MNSTGGINSALGAVLLFLPFLFSMSDFDYTDSPHRGQGGHQHLPGLHPPSLINPMGRRLFLSCLGTNLKEDSDWVSHAHD